MPPSPPPPVLLLLTNDSGAAPCPFTPYWRRLPGKLFYTVFFLCVGLVAAAGAEASALGMEHLDQHNLFHWLYFFHTGSSAQVEEVFPEQLIRRFPAPLCLCLTPCGCIIFATPLVVLMWDLLVVPPSPIFHKLSVSPKTTSSSSSPPLPHQHTKYISVNPGKKGIGEEKGCFLENINTHSQMMPHCLKTQ